MARSLIRVCAALAAALSFAGPAARAEETRVSLTPERAAAWRTASLLDALRDGAREPRELRIVTSPPGAQLELAYLRDGARLAHARGAAPLVATLPGRALVGAGDRVVVRAEHSGFASKAVAFGAHDAAPSLRIELSPLPATLLAVSLLELGNQSRFELRADRPLGARLATTSRGWRLVLAGVAANAEVGGQIEALHGRAFERARLHRAGGDWIVELTRAPSETREPRLLRRDEPVRTVSRLALEWVGERAARGAPPEARAALDGATRGAFDACGAAFEEVLLATLGMEALARELAPRSAFTDAYVAAALERIAARSPSAELALRDGTHLRFDSPLARASAATRAAEVRGLLIAIRALAEELAPPGAAQRTLHAWLAPERAREDFAVSLAQAGDAELRCRLAMR